MSPPRLDYALAVVCGIVVLGLSFWHSLSIAHGCYINDGLIHQPGSPIVLAYVVYVCLRHSRPLLGVVVGAAAAAVWGVPFWVSHTVGGKWSWWDGTSFSSVVAAVAAGLGLVLSTAAWLAKLIWRRMAGRTQTGASASPGKGRSASGFVLALLTLALLSLFVDSLGWSLGRDLFQPLQYWTEDAPLWEGWLTVFNYERVAPVLLGSLACWSLLRRKRWAGRVTVAYFIVTAAFAVARFAAFRYIRVDDTPPLGFEWEGHWSVYDIAVFRFTALDTVALVEAGLRAALCAVGLAYIARSRRLRDWLSSGRPRPTVV